MNKQIEEMKQEINTALARPCGKAKCLTCEFINEENCEPAIIADHLYKQCYRKSTDVAREIFKEIQSYCIGRRWRDRDIVSFEIDAVKYVELKKKYESEGADDEF